MNEINIDYFTVKFQNEDRKLIYFKRGRSFEHNCHTAILYDTAAEALISFYIFSHAAYIVEWCDKRAVEQRRFLWV